MPSVKKAAAFFVKERNAYLKLCEGINTPRALTCSLLARDGQWGELLNLQNHFDDQNIPHSADDYLVTSVLRKNPRLPLGVDREQVALQKFLECEEHVQKTNRAWSNKKHLRNAPDHVASTLIRARRIIRRILGPLTERDLESVWSYARFGNGSTSSVRGNDVSASNKYSALSATPRLAAFVKTLVPTIWWEGAGTLVMPVDWTSCVTTVSKNAKTDRVICIEPHLNIWVQLGVGKLLRHKLKHFGLDLDHQADVNRFLASVAHELGLCTIDLESASDTIARLLVERLIPKRWLHLLELCRTDMAKMPDGTIIGLEKWSSMGNGYTFELESLIFYALALAVSDDVMSTAAFGDDLIVPQWAAPTLIDTLNYCGFRVNGAKTFLAGSFFESCGTDWLSGVDIRPFFWDSEISSPEDEIDALFKMANQLRCRRNYKTRFSPAKDRRLLPAWLRIYNFIPPGWRNCRVPAGYGEDHGLISNFDEAAPTYDHVFGEYIYQRRCRRPVTVKPVKAHGYLLAFLKSTNQRHADRLSYLDSEPRLTVRLRSNGELRFIPADDSTDLRNVKTRGFHAVGRCNIWPNLGHWV